MPTTEQEYAEMEAEANDVEKQYFEARPHLNIPGNHMIFYAGFIRGWKRRGDHPNV